MWSRRSVHKVGSFQMQKNRTTRHTSSRLDAVSTQAGDPWPQLGAGPKTLVSSIPCHSEPWIVAGKNNHGGRRSSRVSPTWDHKLQNMFSPLEEVVTKSRTRSRHLPSSPVHPAGRESSFSPLTAEPRQAASPVSRPSEPRILPARSAVRRNSRPTAPSPDQGQTPASLIIGDFIARSIKR